MVDRIVPATQPEDIEQLREVCGYVDEGVVKTESFSQWVIEGRFASGRPPWEALGVDMVEDVAPFELAKLRLLNGAHSAIAYLGYLAGYRYVHEVIADAVRREPKSPLDDTRVGGFEQRRAVQRLINTPIR